MIRRIKSLLLENKTSSQTIVKNAFWLSLSQVGGRAIRAFAIIYVARMLGTSEYGVFSYAIGLAGFFTLFADIGINSVLTRNAAQKPEQARAYFATAFWMKVVLLILTALAVIFIAPSFSNIPGATALMPLVAMIVVFDNLRDFWSAYFRSQEKMEREAFITMLTNIAIAIFCVGILFYSRTAYAITYAYVGSVLVGSLAGFVLLREEFVRIVANFKMEYAKEILDAAWATAIIGLLGSFMLSLDVVMLGWLTNSTAIGLYSAAQRIIQVLYMIPTVIASAIFTALSRAVALRDEETQKNLMEKSMAILFSVAIPLTIGGIMLGEPLMRAVFGTAYLPATLTFQIFMATILFVFPGTLIGNFILANHKQRDVALYVGTAVLMNVALDYALIIPFGIAGCAAATLIVAAGFNSIMNRFAQRILPFRLFYHIKTPLIASIVMGLADYWFMTIGMHIMPIVLLSILIYVAALITLKDPVIQDAKILIQKIKA